MGKTKMHNPRSLYFPERITYAMDEIMEYPLTIVEAPMGYGKTTAVRECMKISGANIQWQRVYDSSMHGFWTGFCNMFEEFDAESSRNLKQLGFPEDCIMRQEALNIIETIEFPKKAVVVIEDYHVVERAEINDFVEYLVRNEIPDLSIVLTVRHISLENLDEMKLKGYVKHITKEIFEFDTKEIKAYYKICGINLKANEAEELYSKTEGWISGLYLLMLNFKKEGFFNATDDINRLIEKAVYTALSDKVKEFLLTMCIFDSFTLKQAVYMYEEADIDINGLLTEITNNNAFVKYDALTKTYQMHNVFTNFLLSELDNKNIKLKLFQRASEWFVKIHEYKKAMHYFCLCKDYDQLLFAMEEEKLKFKDKYLENDKELLIKYIEECPSVVKIKHHMALLMYAIRLLSYNEMVLFRKVCNELIGNIQSDESLSDVLRKQYLGEYELLICFTQHNNITKMMQHINNAHKLLSEPSFLFNKQLTTTTFGAP